MKTYVSTKKQHYINKYHFERANFEQGLIIGGKWSLDFYRSSIENFDKKFENDNGVKLIRDTFDNVVNVEITE